MASRLDVHQVYREGPVVKGGVNFEYQITERPPDPPPMRRQAIVARDVVEVERQDDGTWVAEVRDVPGARARGATRELAVAGAQSLAGGR